MPTAVETNGAGTEDRLTFPPFPTAPPGVTIIPFKNFKECGIQMFASDGNEEIERDGLGIPTVELRVRHDTDACKTETKRKRKSKKTEQSKKSVFSGARKEWWEQWIEGEDLRISGPYNPHTASIDRLYEAASDFRRGRTWPSATTGISNSWDQFRLFVGLLSNTPVWTRTDKPTEEGESDDDIDDEAEFDAEGSADASKTNLIETTLGPEPRKPARLRSRPPYALYGLDPIPVGSDAEVKMLLENEKTRREEAIIEFLNDPEEKMKIFLSSYMRKQGLIWSDKNLINIPHLLKFFINFLLRNRVFTEPYLDRDLRRCLNVIELAQKELILTSKLAKELPDSFGKGCKSCWGQKADGYKPVEPMVEGPEKSEPMDDTKDTDEPNAKRTKLSSDHKKNSDPVEAAKTAVEKFEEELRADNVEVIKVNNDAFIKDAEKLQIMEENLDPAADAVPGWGWGNTTQTDFPMLETDPWAVPPIDWAPPKINTLFRLLGPTALPLTHTTGVVECSVRRIKSFAPPPAPSTLPRSPVSGEEDPDAVDVELERHFAKVVLTPWPGWDKAQDEMPHLAKPRILETSRGPIASVVMDDSSAKVATVSRADGVKAHDPFNDDITLLVDPALLVTLSVGLGIGGTWVQLAREHDLVGEGAKKKKKSKSKKVSQRYWYVDELMLILPSYHT